MNEALGVFLVKEQAVFGTPADDLVGTNYFPALKGSKIDVVPEFTQIEECSAGYDQELGVRGFVNINGELAAYVRSLGLTTAPDIGLIAKAAGMTETITYYQITLTPGADKTATWQVGDTVQNDTGNGDDWTGTIAAISATSIRVTLVTGTYLTINIADGIENTTRTDVTTVSAKTSSNKYSYAPAFAALGSDLSIWHYTGGIGASASILTKSGNCVGDWKIEIEAGKPAKFTLSSIKGKYISETAATVPTPTKTRTAYPAALAWTVSYNGVSYKVIKATIEGSNAVEQFIDGTEAYGYSKGNIGDKKCKFNLQFYSDASLALPSVGGLASAVESAFSLTYGPTNGQVGIGITYPQTQAWPKSAVGNLTVFDVSGIATRNAVSIAVNNDLT
jgi:hypothetical protein